MMARLARRRSKMYRKPLRAFCMAVRASDQRITPWNASCSRMREEVAGCELMVARAPSLALARRTGGGDSGRWVEHEVEVSKKLLVEICRAVSIEPPGELYDEVAKKLGVDKCSLAYLRKNGVLRERFLKGLDGRRGKPVPLVFTWKTLDPSAWGKERPDPIWGCMWEYHAERLRDDFSQVLVRRPKYRVMRGRENFLGWRWVCPGCKREVKTVYLPVRPPDLAARVGIGKLLVDGFELREPPTLRSPARLSSSLRLGPEGSSSKSTRLSSSKSGVPEEGERGEIRNSNDEIRIKSEIRRTREEVSAAMEMDGGVNECFACKRCHDVVMFTRGVEVDVESVGVAFQRGVVVWE